MQLSFKARFVTIPPVWQGSLRLLKVRRILVKYVAIKNVGQEKMCHVYTTPLYRETGGGQVKNRQDERNFCFLLDKVRFDAIIKVTAYLCSHDNS